MTPQRKTVKFFCIKQFPLVSQPSAFPHTACTQFPSTKPPLCPVSIRKTDNTNYFNIVLFTYFQISKLTGLALYKVSTQQPNNTTTLTTQGQQIEFINNLPDGRTQISHSVCYFYNFRPERKTIKCNSFSRSLTKTYSYEIL